MSSDYLLQLSIDEHGAIENPHLTSHQVKYKRPWAGYIYRRFDTVKIVRDAFLPRDDSGRLVEVTRVPKGVYLGFGAEIQGPDDTWVKTRSLYQVVDRSSSMLTLRPVTEMDIPAPHELDPEADPTLAWLEAELARTLEHVQRLTWAVKQLRAEAARSKRW